MKVRPSVKPICDKCKVIIPFLRGGGRACAAGVPGV